MEIKQTMKEIYQNNVEKGFWDFPRNTGEILMLITSELAEALEADRKGKVASLEDYEKYIQAGFQYEGQEKIAFEKYIKDSFESEIADAVIRLFDICEGMGIDLEKHIQYKMAYNKTREKMHGKKY